MPAATQRIEIDFLGSIAVPADALFGPQTARAIENFQISGIRLWEYPSLVRSLAMVKRAAASANAELGDLDEGIGRAMVIACDEIIAGKHKEHFGIDVFQGGAGTSTNMNMNEVIANRALQILGHPLGTYSIVHPNDHVNRSQSTNDVYPTALRMAACADSAMLRAALLSLSEAFDKKAIEFSDVVKLGRTQLQDAVPMTLGQEFGAFATTIREDVLRLDEGVRLLSEVNVGGTAIGTGIAANPRSCNAVLKHLEAMGVALIPAEDLMEASWDAGAFVTFSGTLKRIAVKLSKIANDLRLLSSGPRGAWARSACPPDRPVPPLCPARSIQ